MAVRSALEAVGEPCSELLDRFFCRDESYRTIGEALEIPAGTIASRISRCLEKVRVELDGRNRGSRAVMSNEMNGYDEERIGRLLRSLPPAPEGWVRAAQELPAARAALDQLVARAEADVAFRQQLEADLESAIAAAGFEPSPFVVSRLRQLLKAV